MTQGTGDPAPGIGARLRSGRERRGLTVLQAAERLHVDPQVVERLEAEQFEALGVAVYVRGYLRHYAELVGENASELQALYSGRGRAPPPDLTRMPRAQPSGGHSSLVLPAAVVALAFAIVGAVGWVVSINQNGPVRPEGPPPALLRPLGTRTAAPPPMPAPVAAPAAAARSTSASNAGTPVSPVAARPAPALTTPPASPAATAAALASNPTAGAMPAAPVAPATARSSPGEPPALTRLTLRFSADSWTEVYDARGERLFYDVGVADTEHTLEGQAPLSLVLGNAGGVRLEVNGRPASLEGHLRPDGSAHVQLSRSGRVRPPRGAAG